jgi:hypothetical protein
MICSDELQTEKILMGILLVDNSNILLHVVMKKESYETY